MSVEGRIIIVTGAGQGIGAQMARDLAAGDALIVIAEMNVGKGSAVAREIVSAGGTAICIQTDISDPHSVQAMVDTTLATHGRIDCLINSAAIFSTIEMKPFYDISLAEWEDVMRVNVTGTFLCCRAVFEAMRSNGFGRIVNFSSQAVSLGRPNYLHYIASKSAIIGMTRSMAREIGVHGITVNAIMPGYTPTEVPRETVSAEQQKAFLAQQSIARLATPKDIVGIVKFLCSEEAGFITGQCHAIDGGHSYP